MKTYFEILGVRPSATPEELKQAYRQKARENHPDKGGDTATFQEISEAGAVLLDKKKRHTYISELKLIMAPCKKCGGWGDKVVLSGWHHREVVACPECDGRGYCG